MRNAVVIILIVGVCAGVNADVAATSRSATGYVVPEAFTPFGPGAVRPEGWLRDWAVAAAEGITGHLDERSPVYGMGWKAVDFKGLNVGPEGTGWPLEQCSYWLDGLVRLAYILDDPELKAKVRARLDPVVDGALTGSRSFIHWRPMSQLDRRFDNWAHSHMGRALVAYYQATGDPRILDALVRVYETYPLPHPDAHFMDVCGSVNLDPMLETYRLSGNAAVLQHALAYAADPEFDKLVDAYLGDQRPTGHTVIFYENIRVPALVYPFTGEERYLRATRHELAKAEREYLLPIGLVSGEEHLAGRGSTRNVETCNVAAGAWTLNWLLRITGERAYADQLEQVFFNAGPAPVARDWQTMSYYQSPNRLEMGRIAEPPSAPGGWGSYQFQAIGHHILCCVGNVNRVIPNYIMHMWMQSADGGLAALLYGPSTLTTEVAGIPVRLTCETKYPFEETLSISVDPARLARFPLHLRIPAWCNQPSLRVNGGDVPVEVNEHGFVVLERSWRKGDRIELRLPMHPSVIEGRENDYPDDLPYFSKNRPLATVRGIHNPWAGVLYGPLLFALPVRDVTADQPAPGVDWNYALDVAPEDAEAKIEVLRSPMREPWNWPLEGPLVLRVPARQFDWDPTNLQPLPAQPVQGGEPCRIDLVPYGTTKFRISMFPVAATAGEPPAR